jgi:hypothetical protein
MLLDVEMRAALQVVSSRSPARPPGEGVSNVSQKAACDSAHGPDPEGRTPVPLAPEPPEEVVPAAPLPAPPEAVPMPLLEPPGATAPVLEPLDGAFDAPLPELAGDIVGVFESVPCVFEAESLQAKRIAMKPSAEYDCAGGNIERFSFSNQRLAGIIFSPNRAPGSSHRDARGCVYVTD